MNSQTKSCLAPENAGTCQPSSLDASAPRQTSLTTSRTLVSVSASLAPSCAVQLYLPPDWMLNKDFLKEVLVEDKRLLTMS